MRIGKAALSPNSARGREHEPRLVILHWHAVQQHIARYGVEAVKAVGLRTPPGELLLAKFKLRLPIKAQAEEIALGAVHIRKPKDAIGLEA